ncbi:MAG: OmpA family protein [Polyangiaceae bacterium]|nr:OmpA family protein [Polyangiaceae bacterium]
MRRTMLRRLAPVACALTVLGLSAGAEAQTQPNAASPPLALNRFYPAPPGDRMFGVQSPYVAGDLTPHFSIVADYAHNPLVLRTVNSGEDRGAIVSDQLFLHFNAAFAFKQRLFVSASFPVALVQGGSSPTANGITFNSPQEADIGDLRIGARVRLLGDYWDPFQLALGGYFWFPTGNGTNGTFVGDGTVRGLPQVIAGGRIADRVVWAFNVGPDIRGSQVFGGTNGVTQATMLRLDGGLGFLLDEGRNLQVGIEANAAFTLDNQTNDPIQRGTNMEVLAGGRYRFLEDFEVGVGAGPGLTSGPGTPDVRVVGMLAYTPAVKKVEPVRDSDGDGIMDPQDSCPTVKGLPNADPKLNGCPDTDGDGIFDAQDACPTVKGLPNANPAVNGCPDTDGDGIFDAQDACPTVKGVPNADPKLHGCPPDSDGDGIADDVDACPTVKGVPNADPKLHGCPPDKDGDGVLDAEDACPEIKGIKTSDPTTNGCPGDRDGDTIRDDKDACPDEKGKPNDDPSKNGCPTSVRVTETEVIILQQVQFDTNKATIKKVSDPLLDEVAEVLREHPELLKLEVQGHTDSKGSPALNKTLSQNRAESVKKALIKRGIGEGRLVPKGYGQDKPIADNNTEEGRAKNRRVQFVIIERTTKDKAPPPDKAPAGPVVAPKAQPKQTPPKAPPPPPKQPAPKPTAPKKK